MGKYFLAISSLVSAMQPVFIANPPVNITVDLQTTTTAETEIAEIEQKTVIKEPVIEIVTSTKVWITAYSSNEDETDNTPFITAYMTNVREGIVATNMFPFGTKLRIPQLFGDKIFTVEDKMHRRKKNFVDIWMPSKEEAKKFGINFTEIAILKNTK